MKKFKRLKKLKYHNISFKRKSISINIDIRKKKSYAPNFTSDFITWDLSGNIGSTWDYNNVSQILNVGLTREASEK